MKNSTFLLSISSLIFVFSAYIISVWLGRSLGPSEYGIYGIIISLMTIVNLIQVAGVPQSLTKSLSEQKDDPESIFKSAFYLQFVTTIILTLIFFLLAKPIAAILNDLSLIQFIQLSSFIFPFYGFFSLYIGYYNGMHNFRKQATLNGLYSLIKAFTVIGFSVPFRVHGAILGFALAPVLTLLYGVHLPKFKSRSYSYKKLILFAIPLIGFALISTLQQTVDLYFIKALLSSKDNPGFYTANQNIARIPFFGLSAFSIVLFPSISRNVSQKLHEHSRLIIHQALRVVMLLLIPGTLLIAATSNNLIMLLFTSNYSPAAPSLSILIFGMGFLTIFTLLSNIINGAGSPKVSLIISILGVILTSFNCILLVPSYELVGAAWSTTIGAFVSMLLAAFFVYQKFHALVSPKRVFKILIASLAIYFLARVIVLPNVYLLPVWYVILFTIYGGLLVLMRELTREDWAQVMELVPGKWRGGNV